MGFPLSSVCDLVGEKFIEEIGTLRKLHEHISPRSDYFKMMFE
eukprot:UN00828